MPRVAVAVLVCAAVLLLSLGTADARDLPPFAPAGLAAFDGATWSGLTLGQTSQRDVKKQFRTERSPYENARLLLQADPTPFRVHALFAARGDKSPLIAVVVERSPGFTVDDLRRAAGEPGEERYPSRRYEEWCILVFAKKGIVAPVCDGKAGSILLVGPKAADNGVALGVARSPVVPYVDPAAGKPRVLEFGRTSVSFRLDGIALDEAKVRAGLERAMQATTAAGTMRFRPDAPGSYAIDIHAVYDARRGGTADFTCRVEGEAPYGPIAVSSSALAMIPAQNSDIARANFSLAGGLQFAAKLQEARLAVEKKVAECVRAQEPPSVGSFREADWQQAFRTLLEAARQAHKGS